MSALHKRIAVFVACALLIVLGLYFWTSDGMGSLSDQNTMGLYIVLFFFFEALCAGCLFLASFSHVEQREKLALIGTAAAVGAGLAIFADLGTLEQAWRLFVAINVASPLLLDVVFLSLCIIGGALLFFALRRGKKKLVSAVSAVMKIVSVLLPLGTAWFCIAIEGRPGWNSPLVIGDFLAQSLLAGLLVCLLVAKGGSKMVTASRIAFVVNLVLIVGAIGIALYGLSGESAYVRELMTGGYAVLFWSQLIVGVLVPMALLFFGKAPKGAAVLGLFGVVAAKYLFVAKGLLFPFHYYGDGVVLPLAWKTPDIVTYIPSVSEVLASAGIVAFCVLLVSALWSFGASTRQDSAEPTREARGGSRA